MATFLRDRKELGKRFKRARRSKGLLQSDVALLVGCKSATISSIECGKAGYSLRLLSKLALAYKEIGCIDSVMQFLEDEETWD